MASDKADRPSSKAGAAKRRTRQTKRNSEARKEQNRIASRTYREKRKQKLALLEQLLGDDEGTQPDSGAAADATPTATQPLPQEKDTTQEKSDVAATTSAADADSLPLNIGFTEIVSLAESAAGAFGLGFDDTSSLAFQDPLLDNAWPNSAGARDVAGVSFGSSNDFVMNPSSTLMKRPEDPENILQASYPDGLLDVSLSKPVREDASSQMGLPLDRYPNLNLLTDCERVGGEPLLSIPSSSTFNSVINSFTRLSPPQKQRALSFLSRFTSSKDSRENRQAESTGSGEQSSQRSQLRNTLGTFLDKLSAMSAMRVPVNTIYIQQNGFFSALLDNALAIGLLHGQTLLEDETVSPFSIKGSGGTLAQARMRYSATPKDLQPVDAQLTIEHHPYLDVIPFPTFRERALQALTCDPPLFSEDEMCSDMCSDGLVIWGSQGNDRGMGACMPSDMRSWEPKLWFLKKYWFLVGGWEDDMWRAARWWHTMRNERLDVPADLPA